MVTGYMSSEAVKDLLAVKEGEKDFLRAEIIKLQNELSRLNYVINSYVEQKK